MKENQIFRTHGIVDADKKALQLLQKPLTLWITGLSGSGKSSLAYALEALMHQENIKTVVLDGDNLRHGLNQDLGFNNEARSEAVRRAAEVAKLFNDAGMVVIVSLISPFAKDREHAAHVIGEENFYDIFMDTPIEVCELRDKKGIYQRARTGEIKDFTGVSSPYEKPQNPAHIVSVSNGDPYESAQNLLNIIKSRII